MILRPTKLQAINIVATRSPLLLESFRDFQALDKGWLIWPQQLIQIRKNLQLDYYVNLYEDSKQIDASFYLFLKGEKAIKEENERLNSLNDEEKNNYIANLTQELMDVDYSELDGLFPDKKTTPEEAEIAKKTFEALPEEEKTEHLKRLSFLYLYLFTSIHNYFSVMVYGEALTSLVPKAVKGNEDAFCKAVNIDRHLLHTHPYFKDRFEKAQTLGHREFLNDVSRSISTPALIGKIQYPGLYIVFAMLQTIGWLHDLTHPEILDICLEARLDRWQKEIYDVNSVTKCLGNYLKMQNDNKKSMQSN